MIERFLRLKSPIKKALHDLNLDHMWKEEYNLPAEELQEALKPIRITVENLSREDSTMLTAEGALKFLFNSLETINSLLSCELLDAIKIEILKRRDKPLVSLLKYLNNPRSLQNEKNQFFSLVSKTEMIKLARTLSSRMFGPINSIDNDDSDVQPIDLEVQPHMEELLLQEQLQLSIAETVKAYDIEVGENKFHALSNEFAILENTGKKTDNLQQLFDALSTIKPTSTQNERNFSIANDFVTKKRNRLADSTINALCFLKSFMKKNISK